MRKIPLILKIVPSCGIGVLAMAGIIFGMLQSSRAQTPDCCIKFAPGTELNARITIYPNWKVPSGNPRNFGYTTPAAFFAVKVEGDEPLPPAIYPAWCVDQSHLIEPIQGTIPGTPYTGTIISTCDAEGLAGLPFHGGDPAIGPPPVVTLETWHKVNYILNHKTGYYWWNVQVALNRLVGGPVPNDPNNPSPPADAAEYPPVNVAEVQAILADANANAANWTLPCGGVVGVLFVQPDPPVQPAGQPLYQIVLLEVPCCSVSFSKCPADVDLGCNPTNIPDCDLTQVAAESCCGYPVNITCEKSESTVGCKTFRILKYTAADAYGHTTTCSQTISWVVDTTAPRVTAPAGGDLGCNPAALPGDDTIKAQVQVADQCNGAATITVSHEDSGSPCAMKRVFIIKVTDACGNAAPAIPVSYTWSVDTTAPRIVSTPAGGSLGCNPAAQPTDDSVKAQVTAADDCDSNPEITVTHTDSGSSCAMTRTFTITAKDRCGNVSAAQTVSYTWKDDSIAPVVTCPPDLSIPTPGGKCVTYPRNTWCGKTVLNDCFRKLYPSGVQCGLPGWGYRKIKFSSCDTVRSFLPKRGACGTLDRDYTDPTNCSAGDLAAEALCLRLNVDCGDNWRTTGFKSGFGDLVYRESGSGCDGKRVRDILDLCDAALSGRNNSGCSPDDLAALCANLNGSFEDGKPNRWCLERLCTPDMIDVPPSQSGKATATDECDGQLTPTYTDDLQAGPCAGTWVITRTWTATDSCGNVGSCQQTITIGNPTSSVCGTVFVDCDGDGDLTRKDTGLKNAVVTIKDATGKLIGTLTTDATGAYCFYNLTAGKYTVTVTPPSGYSQTAGTSTKHWKDKDGRYCWRDNDGYDHWKGSDKVDCWYAKDGYLHWKDSNGRDCWKDRYGKQYSQPWNYKSCNDQKSNSETFTLDVCEAKTEVDFAYYGNTPKVDCQVSAPDSARCGQKIKYTCKVTNTGTQWFSKGCTVNLWGKSYACPPLKPGESWSCDVDYYVQRGDYGNLDCNATVYCYPSSGNSYKAQSSCRTRVSL